jgi:hypothetical protein
MTSLGSVPIPKEFLTASYEKLKELIPGNRLFLFSSSGSYKGKEVRESRTRADRFDDR